MFGLRRSEAPLPQGVIRLRADLSDGATLEVIPEGVDAVVYAAAADRSDEASYRRAYVAGVQNLGRALAARARLPARAVFVSSTSVYGESEGAWVDESTASLPESFRGRLMLEGEAAAASLAARAASLRLGGIYGPGRTRLIERVARAEVTLRGRQFTNRIHRDDAASAVAHLLSLEELGELYVGVDHEPAELGEVVRWIAQQLGVAPPAPETEGSADIGGKRCSSARLRGSGFVFEYPTYREGYPAIVASYLAAQGIRRPERR